MNSRSGVVVASVVGILLFAIGVAVVDRLMWWQCGGVPFHDWGKIWVCRYIIELHVVASVVAGIAAGFLGRRRGLVVGTTVALAGLVLFSFAVRYPFGSDHVAAVKHAAFYYVLPAAIASVLAARLRSGGWKHAL